MRRAGLTGAIFVAILILAGAGAGGWWIYDEHKQAEGRAQVTPHVKNATLRVQDALSLMQESGSMSYAEAFRKLDDHVAEIDKRVLDLRSMDTSGHAEFSESAVAYMKKAQELVRVEANLFRKMLATSSKMEWFTGRVNGADRSSIYSLTYSLKQIREAKDEAHRAYGELATAATLFDVAFSDFTKQRDAAAAHLERAMLVDDKTIGAARAAVAKMKDGAVTSQRGLESINIK